MTENRRAVIYARVSTLDKGQKPEAQVDALQEFARKGSWDVVEVFLEHVSTRKAKLPMRAAVLDLARRGKVDAILTWKLDRWGRSLADLVATWAELDALGVSLVIPGESDPRTPQGRAFRAMAAVFAEFERELARERVLMGLAHAKAKGRVGGRPPISAEKVRQILQLLAEGKTWNQVAKAAGVGVRTVARTLAGWKAEHAGELPQAGREVAAAAINRILEGWKKWR